MILDSNGDKQFIFNYNNGISDDNNCVDGRNTIIIWHCSQDYSQDIKMIGQQLSQCSYQIDVFASNIC